MKELEESYRRGNLILFVGAGVSKHLGLPTWSELIEEVARKLDFDSEVFKTYGDSLALAEYYRLKTGSIGPLRSWMDQEWHKTSINVEASDIHNLIIKGNFHYIYTTNYDRWLETAHQKAGVSFTKIANVGDLTKIKEGSRQIIKFHGDFDDDTSLVLDETSYFERLHFETPLDIKLRSDVLGKSVLFIGYSLTDINIRLLFYKLNKIWDVHGYRYAKPNSYLFTSRPNPVQEAILEGRGIKVITTEAEDAGAGLVDFMKNLVKP